AAGGGVGILRTTDAGLHWNQYAVPDPLGVSCIDAVDGMTAWCSNTLSHGNMFFTSDGGQSWTQQIINTGNQAVEGLSFPTRNIGYGTGGVTGFLIKTTNGGSTWTTFYLAPGTGYLHAVHFLDSLNGLVVGGATIYRIINGGPGRLEQKDTLFSHSVLYGCYLATQ